MVLIPQEQPALTPEEAFARLQSWYAAKAALATQKTAEVVERRALAGYYFPEFTEGTTRLDIGGGYDLMVVRSLSRKVDEAALENVKAAQAKKLKLNLDLLFPVKPTLSVAEYRKLDDTQRAFVDTLLDIKEGDTPKLDIVQRSDEATQARAAAHKAPPPPPPSTAPAPVIVEDASTAEPGNYYTDGDGNWWQLSPEMDWDEILTPAIVEILEQANAGEEAPPPPPARKARKARKSRKAAAEE